MRSTLLLIAVAASIASIATSCSARLGLQADGTCVEGPMTNASDVCTAPAVIETRGDRSFCLCPDPL